MSSEVPSNRELEALQLLEKAQKKLNSFSFFGLLSGGQQSKYEDAADLCSKAGNLYKMDKKWKEAGDAYKQSAEYSLQSDDRDEAANKLLEASKCYKKSNPQEAVAMLVQAVDMLKERGRFHPAAGYLKQIAEIYESDIVDLQLAMRYYEDAAELYSGEEAAGLANQCWLKFATFAGQLEHYDKAIEKFEHVGIVSLDNNLTKYSAKQYFLNAGLCYLCRDSVTAKNAFQRYCDLDPTFSQSREYKLLVDVAEAYEEGDAAKFSGVVQEYDRMTKLDPWKTTILLRVKRMIAEEPSLT